MKPICLICARGGSRGVTNKNIRIINKKPLIAHTIEKAINSKIFSHVVVSTEDKKIARISKKLGAEIPFIRPKNLATGTIPVGDVFLHAIKKLQTLEYEFDTFVNLDCTVPFLKIEDILGSINLLKKKKCDVVYGVYRQHLNPYYNIVELDSKGNLKLVKRDKKKTYTRQKASIVYQLNGLITINVERFLKYKRIYMPRCVPCEIQPETGLMIDTKFEFQIADCMAKNLIKF